MKRKRRCLLGVGLVGALLGVTSCNPGQGNTQKAPAQAPAAAPTVTVTAVVSQALNRQIRLPGELLAYQDVALYPKVQSFVEWIGVDRGSAVKRGQLLARMSAPEITAQRGEAEAKARAAAAQRSEAEARAQGARAQRLEAEAKLASDEATYKRLKAASATPGVVAGNDVEVAEKLVEADRARVRLWEENEKAAQAQAQALTESEKAARQAAHSSTNIASYLRITAPFDGVVTERNVHPGSLAGPAGGPAAPPMLRLQQIARLRLVVSVPEADVAGIQPGTPVTFTVPAFPGETFRGAVARVGYSLEARTRSMPVELEVSNASRRLAPGMFAEVLWPARRPHPSLFVPPSAVASTTERTFVVRVRNSLTEWVDVKRGVSMGEQIEVFGDLAAGDFVALRGTDELRAGTRVVAKPVASAP